MLSGTVEIEIVDKTVEFVLIFCVKKNYWLFIYGNGNNHMVMHGTENIIQFFPQECWAHAKIPAPRNWKNWLFYGNARDLEKVFKIFSKSAERDFVEIVEISTNGNARDLEKIVQFFSQKCWAWLGKKYWNFLW